MFNRSLLVFFLLSVVSTPTLEVALAWFRTVSRLWCGFAVVSPPLFKDLFVFFSYPVFYRNFTWRIIPHELLLFHADDLLRFLSRVFLFSFSSPPNDIFIVSLNPSLQVAEDFDIADP